MKFSAIEVGFQLPVLDLAAFVGQRADGPADIRDALLDGERLALERRGIVDDIACVLSALAPG